MNTKRNYTVTDINALATAHPTLVKQTKEYTITVPSKQRPVYSKINRALKDGFKVEGVSLAADNTEQTKF